MTTFVVTAFPDEKKAYEGVRALQAKQPSAGAKSRIDARIADVRADQTQRLAKLAQAGKLAQGALRPQAGPRRCKAARLPLAASIPASNPAPCTKIHTAPIRISNPIVTTAVRSVGFSSLRGIMLFSPGMVD